MGSYHTHLRAPPLSCETQFLLLRKLKLGYSQNIQIQSAMTIAGPGDVWVMVLHQGYSVTEMQQGETSALGERRW